MTLRGRQAWWPVPDGRVGVGCHGQCYLVVKEQGQAGARPFILAEQYKGKCGVCQPIGVYRVHSWDLTNWGSHL